MSWAHVHQRISDAVNEKNSWTANGVNLQHQCATQNFADINRMILQRSMLQKWRGIANRNAKVGATESAHDGIRDSNDPAIIHQ